MGIGIDVSEVDTRVQRTLAAVTDEAERRIGELLTAADAAFAERFDPERRSSLVSRALADFTRWRDDALGKLDPAAAGSHTSVLLDRLSALLGPDGLLEERLGAALDLDAGESALARLDAGIAEQFRELRDLVVGARERDEGRAEEAQRGTAQGLDFEDTVEAWLRAEAAALGGCVVERTARTPGALGPNCAVGDFVVTLPGGQRVVVEAKNQAGLALAGSGGILAELDQALANREAAFAVCVSGKPAFPTEVGAFGVYGDRLLVVDEGRGTMTAVALRWAAAILDRRADGAEAEVDAAFLAERIERIRELAERFRGARRALTEAGKSLDTVRESLSAMRSELIELADDVHRQVCRRSGADR
jgi:hypothetical protein